MKKWAEMTWEEIDRLSRNILLILPVGSTEQHGQRLPVKTDYALAHYWAKLVAEKIIGSVVLPTLSYGMSSFHIGFPGSISINGSVYTLVICDILESITKHGFCKILIINGHGGNDEWIDQAIIEICEKYPEVRIINPVIKIIKSIDNNWLNENFGENQYLHAGAAETSLVNIIFPEIVRSVDTVTSVPSKDLVVEDKLEKTIESPSAWLNKFPKGQKGNQTHINQKGGDEINNKVLLELEAIARKIIE